MAISVGKKFHSLQELQGAMKKLEQETNTIFVRQDSIKTKIPDLKDTLIYDRILFACKQGRERKSVGTGQRIQRSVKLGCSAKVRAVLKEENGTWAFVLTMVNLDHDVHTPSEEDLALFPEMRKIEPTSVMEILMGYPDISAKDIAKVVAEEQGKHVLIKDVHNFRQRYRCRHASSQSHFQPGVLDSGAVSAGQISSTVSPAHKAIRSHKQYQTADLLTKKICSFMSVLEEHDFEDKYGQLSSLFSSWKEDPVDVKDISLLCGDGLSQRVDIAPSPYDAGDVVSKPVDFFPTSVVTDSNVSRPLDAPSSSSSDPQPEDCHTFPKRKRNLSESFEVEDVSVS